MNHSPQQPSLGRITSLHRYPVKSLVGEEVGRVFVDERGVNGDRLWSVRDPDGKFGSGKSTRRFRKMEGLLALRAHYDAETPVIDFPDGRSLRGDDKGIHEALSVHVGRPVTLAREENVSHFDEGPIHLVTTSGLGRLELAHGHPVDPRRFRPNVVLATPGDSGFIEESWIGFRIELGDELVIEIRSAMPRCVMVNLPQTSLPSDRGLLGAVTDLNQAMFGVVADVVRPGAVAVGDVARMAT